MWRKILWSAVCVFGAVVVAAILFPMFAQAKPGRFHMRVIDGVIVDGADRPIPGLEVSLIGFAGKPLGVIRTDAKGEFHVDPKLDAVRIDHYEHRDYRKPIVNHKVVVKYQFETGILYEAPKADVTIQRLKGLRFGILVDDHESLLGLFQTKAIGDDGKTSMVQTDRMGQFKFPAVLKNPSIEGYEIAGFRRTSDGRVYYAVYRSLGSVDRQAGAVPQQVLVTPRPSLDPSDLEVHKLDLRPASPIRR